jgi:hypothetical protein
MLNRSATVGNATWSNGPATGRRMEMLREKWWWKWAIRLELVVALYLTIHYNNLLAPAENPNIISLQYIWIGAVAAAGLVALARFQQRPSPVGWNDLLVLGAAIPLIVWWVLDRGMVHIGGYEHSLLANYGWLQLQGMRPHVDFPCTLCPHFYLGIKYAFAWFGVAWRSHVILAAIYAGISFTWGYFLLRSMEISKTSAALIALLAQSLCLMMGGHFWYNAVGSTDAIVLFLAALAWVDRPRSRLLFASVTIATALVLLDKPNGWAMLPCLAIGFFGSGQHRFRFPACVLGAVGVVAVVAYIGPFDITATLRAYARLSKSRPPGIDAVRHSLNFLVWHGPVEATKISAYVATFLTAVPLCLLAHRSKWRTADGRWWAKIWVYAGALATGAALFLTNYEVKCTDLAVPTVAFAVWVAKCEPWKTRTFDATLPQVVGVFGVWFCLFSMVRAPLNAWVRNAPFHLAPVNFAVPMVAFAVWVASCQPLGFRRSVARCIYAGAVVVALMLFWIGYEPTFSDVAIATVAIAAVVARPQFRGFAGFNADPRQVAAVFGAWLCLFCLCQGLFNGWARYRVAWICNYEFWQREMSAEQPATPFFAGVHGGPRLISVLNDLDHAVRKRADDQIFFGPWIEFAYPAFGRKPPQGFPVWWHPGISYFPEDAAFALDAFRSRRFDVLIFLSRNFFQMPEESHSIISEYYTIEEYYDTLTVYRRKPGGREAGFTGKHETPHE